MSVFIWPGDLGGGLGDLAETLKPDLAPEPLQSLEGDGLEGGDHTVILVVAGDPGRSAECVRWLDEVDKDGRMNLVVIVDDSYLGGELSPARAADSGAVVSSVRSIAVARGTTVRANVVCVPESLVAESGELRGPLPHTTDTRDVAEAIRLFAGPDGSYLSGQILFVNGGRQLFSSHTS